MRSRPWPIVLLALIQLFTPLATVMLNAHYYQLPFFMTFHQILLRMGARESVDFLVLPVVAAAAIYLMKTWTFPIFLMISLRAMVLNYRDWHGTPGLTWLWVSLDILNIAFVTYFFLPAVRKPYFDARLRWWESKPRFKIEIDGAVVISKRPIPCHVLDFSEGGAFFRFTKDHDLDVGDQVTLKLDLLALHMDLNSKVVHKGPGGAAGFGIQFTKLDHVDKKKVRRFVRALALLGIETRHRPINQWEDFSNWVRRLAKTGEGLVPSIPIPGKPRTAKVASLVSPKGKDDAA